MLRWLRSLVLGRPAPKAAAPRPAVRARYENALTTDENRRHWWAADYLSAKASNSFQVRRMLRMRSRHEVSNNPYLYGIANSNADDLVGTGPTLKVTTTDPAFNREVESSWAAWCAEVRWCEKVRTCKLAKTVDGEGFLVFKTNPDLRHPVKLYPVDVEADQVTTPAPTDLAQLWVDGMTLHPVTGRPVAFHVLKHHPGDYYFPDFNPLAVEQVPARHVVHWFAKFRPGQVRGVPTFTPALDLFTELRCFRKATLRAAETAADLAVLLTSDAPAAGDDEDAGDELKPFDRAPLDRGMMAQLPAGMDAKSFQSAAPATTYEMFSEKCLAEACRPLNYPLHL
jgi:capsid protein